MKSGRRGVLPFALIILSVSACDRAVESAPPTVPAVSAEAAQRAAASITGSDVARRIETLAHDSLRGRATPSPELDAAARWIASEFEAFGLQPLLYTQRDDPGFVQWYAVPQDQNGGAPGSAPQAPNVVGAIRGSDPQLSNEYVVFSAHIDHVGVGRPDALGDSIYNGADDNASGTAVMMEVAEAMASLDPAPRRSLLFVLVSGEEKGLWGSEHFVANAPVAIDDMVAAFNADMVGRNWPDTIVAIGKEHSDLGATLERVNARYPELGMTAIDDRWPEEQFYFRSDHINFARQGIPVLFFFNGTHADYHEPSDEAERIDADKAARIGQLLFHLGLEVADAEQRPVWQEQSRREIVTRR
jgi:hypothetical protein